jgi:hypothetical protein
MKTRVRLLSRGAHQGGPTKGAPPRGATKGAPPKGPHQGGPTKGAPTRGAHQGGTTKINKQLDEQAHGLYFDDRRRRGRRRWRWRRGVLGHSWFYPRGGQHRLGLGLRARHVRGSGGRQVSVQARNASQLALEDCKRGLKVHEDQK